MVLVPIQPPVSHDPCTLETLLDVGAHHVPQVDHGRLHLMLLLLNGLVSSQKVLKKMKLYRHQGLCSMKIFSVGYFLYKSSENVVIISISSRVEKTFQCRYLVREDKYVNCNYPTLLTSNIAFSFFFFCCSGSWTQRPR